MKSMITALVFLGSVSAFAAGNSTTKPCQQIKVACEGAGFVKGHHKEKKGLYKDCVDPIISGQTVAGVNIGPEVVTACKDKKMAHNKAK